VAALMTSEMTLESLALTLLSKIRNNEQELRGLSESLAVEIPKASLAQINTRVVQLAQLMTRRRTLIEVWELSTGRGWGVADKI
jgi:hypothetical protein